MSIDTESVREILRKKQAQLDKKLADPKTSDHMRRYVLRIEAPRMIEAVQRLAEGQYGICVACGELIPEKRLQAIPEIDTCKPCEKPEKEFLAP